MRLPGNCCGTAIPKCRTADTRPAGCPRRDARNAPDSMTLRNVPMSAIRPRNEREGSPVNSPLHECQVNLRPISRSLPLDRALFYGISAAPRIRVRPNFLRSRQPTVNGSRTPFGTPALASSYDWALVRKDRHDKTEAAGLRGTLRLPRRSLSRSPGRRKIAPAQPGLSRTGKPAGIDLATRFAFPLKRSVFIRARESATAENLLLTDSF
jgi:hypothetical protein